MPDVSFWVTAIATAVLVAITFANLRIFKRSFEARFEPHVIVTLGLDENSTGQVIMLIIRNIGTGLAEEVTFDLSRPIPKWAGGIRPESADIRADMTEGPLISGIPSFGPGESRKLLWGQYGGLLKALGQDPITITCRFKRSGRPMPPIQCQLEVASFMEIAVPQNPILEVAAQTKKLARTTEKLHAEIRTIRQELSKYREHEAKPCA